MDGKVQFNFKFGSLIDTIINEQCSFRFCVFIILEKVYDFNICKYERKELQDIILIGFWFKEKYFMSLVNILI